MRRTANSSDCDVNCDATPLGSRECTRYHRRLPGAAVWGKLLVVLRLVTPGDCRWRSGPTIVDQEVPGSIPGASTILSTEVPT